MTSFLSDPSIFSPFDLYKQLQQLRYRWGKKSKLVDCEFEHMSLKVLVTGQ